jgi:ABC-type bacteriocin/lantibiotic exporter with double-glycine peptidase domain
MIRWYPQEQRASCVTACVRMVLSGLGQDWSEKELRRRLGHSPVGLSLDEACQSMQLDGVQADFHTDWNLLDLRDCLRAGWAPIVGLERRFFGHADALHAVVLLEISSQTIRALDPLGSASAELFKLEAFELAWASAGQQALVIKSSFPFSP